MGSSSECMFLGKPVSYWVELEKRVTELNCGDLLAEIYELTSKVAFYESRIKQMSQFTKDKE